MNKHKLSSLTLSSFTSVASAVFITAAISTSALAKQSIPNIDEKSTCIVPNDIMLGILFNEQPQKRKWDYPYIIRVNYKKNTTKYRRSRFILDHFGSTPVYSSDPYVFDCKSEIGCQETLNYLVKYNLKNVDIGPFQVNFYYHPNEIRHFFNFQSNYLMACAYVESLIKRKGYSWKTIAGYHSFTPKHNAKYLKRLQQNVKKIRKEKKSFESLTLNGDYR